MHCLAVSLHVASYPGPAHLPKKGGPGYEACVHVCVLCSLLNCTGRLLAAMSPPRCVLVQGVCEGEGGGNSGTQADRKSVFWRRL